jgi:hypothetical protein
MTPLLLIAALVAADPAPVMKDGLAGYLASKGTERAKERAAAELRGTEARLEIAKRGRIVPGQPDVRELPSKFDLRAITFPGRKEKDAYIKDRELEVKEARDKLTRKLPPVPPPLHYANMKAGAVGELAFGELSGYGGPPFVEVVQVIDKGNMIVKFEKDKLLWVEHDTTELVDDETVSVADICWQVIGTKTYRSTDGATKTVFHLGPLK